MEGEPTEQTGRDLTSDIRSLTGAYKEIWDRLNKFTGKSMTPPEREELLQESDAKFTHIAYRAAQALLESGGDSHTLDMIRAGFMRGENEADGYRVRYRELLEKIALTVAGLANQANKKGKE